MNELFKVILVSTAAGVLGTGAGGFIITLVKRPKRKTLCFLLTFAAGIMVAVVFHDLIPEALALGSIASTIVGVLFGLIGLNLLNHLIPHTHLPQRRKIDGKHQPNRLLRTGLLLGLGIAIHNFPEGIAIGAGYIASDTLGFGLALALALHNIPEGMAMAAPLLAGGLNKTRIVFWAILAGLPMGLGALAGSIFGGLSIQFLSAALGFAAGAMLFLVFHELFPEAKKLNSPRSFLTGTFVGAFIGIIVLRLL